MAEPDPAVSRFYIIQFLRLGGAILVVAAILILTDTIDAPDIVGYALLAVGLADFFLMPTFLARKWSSREK
ncbi:hypothetical protein [Qipengyuania aquimaris]|uniref:hypothetical protein n=1 Tax=Qipengyuania aquimaris TaxID=255984 RepID=UPI001FD0CA03|nr:hypothetical protein [Qipengyuania aquimaris]UOR15631.1 hypothetical protein LCM05_00905 [Qipengyuania aquimaris]